MDTVLTNYHVIKGASEVKVIFHNGKEVSAKVVNYQEDADLAVLKIAEKVEMPGVLEFGDSDASRSWRTGCSYRKSIRKRILWFSNNRYYKCLKQRNASLKMVKH